MHPKHVKYYFLQTYSSGNLQTFFFQVHGLLDWLAEVEGRLRATQGADLPSQLAAAGSVRAALAAERPRLESVKEACAAILDRCHPDAEPALKEWKRVVATRWKVRCPFRGEQIYLDSV